MTQMCTRELASNFGIEVRPRRDFLRDLGSQLGGLSGEDVFKAFNRRVRRDLSRSLRRAGDEAPLSKEKCFFPSIFPRTQFPTRRSRRLRCFQAFNRRVRKLIEIAGSSMARRNPTGNCKDFTPHSSVAILNATPSEERFHEQPNVASAVRSRPRSRCRYR